MKRNLSVLFVLATITSLTFSVFAEKRVQKSRINISNIVVVEVYNYIDGCIGKQIELAPSEQPKTKDKTSIKIEKLKRENKRI